MDFGDLKDDSKIQTKITSLHTSIAQIEKTLSLLSDANVKGKLSLKEQTDYDLFMAYTLNTLFWMYLITKGIDPNTNEVKNQLKRVKDYMIKAKQAHERNTIRPKLKKDVASRFIKHGISHQRDGEPAAKKTKA